MPAENILNTLDFTKSTGAPSGDNDDRFNDAIRYGEYPTSQKITSINTIQLYKSDESDGDAVIVGLKVEYTVDSSKVTVVHGNVTPYLASSQPLVITSKQLLVGASGRLKENSAIPTKAGRIAHIIFSIYDSEKGETTVTPPLGGLGSGITWGSYGQIIAFQGSTTDTLGLTSLGFVTAVRGTD